MIANILSFVCAPVFVAVLCVRPAWVMSKLKAVVNSYDATPSLDDEMRDSIRRLKKATAELEEAWEEYKNA